MQKPSLQKIEFGAVKVPQTPLKSTQKKQKAKKPQKAKQLRADLQKAQEHVHEMMSYGQRSLGMTQEEAQHALRTVQSWKSMTRKEFRQSCHKLAQDTGVRQNSLKTWACMVHKLSPGPHHRSFELWMQFEEYHGSEPRVRSAEEWDDLQSEEDLSADYEGYGFEE